MSDDPKDNKNPIRPYIKEAVQATNRALASVESFTEEARQPFKQGFKVARELASKLGEQASYTYQRRHEFAPEIIGGSTIVGAGVLGMSRGRVGAIIGAAGGYGVSYAIVYDQFNMQDVPDIIFGKKE